MYRYHGLNREDAVFFNMSDLICNLARTEDCIIVGRCADIILRNNYIPHISLFISAPFEVRLQYMMNVREMDQKTAVKFLKKMDRQHKKYYEFYTSEKWGTPENYDLCINSANYGIKETIEIIERADFVLIFWDGTSKGTRYAIEQCEKLGVDYRVYRREGAVG